MGRASAGRSLSFESAVNLPRALRDSHIQELRRCAIAGGIQVQALRNFMRLPALRKSESTNCSAVRLRRQRAGKEAASFPSRPGSP